MYVLEQNLDDDPDLVNELDHQKCFIYPRGKEIIFKTKQMVGNLLVN